MSTPDEQNTPLVGDKTTGKGAAPSDAPKRNDKRKIHPPVMACLVLLGLVAASILAIVITTIILQYGVYARPNTTDEDADKPIRTFQSFAFILSGPLTPLGVFFAGAVAAFVLYTCMNPKRKILLGLQEMILLSILFIATLTFQTILVVESLNLKKYSETIHSASDAEVIGLEAIDLDYVGQYFTSPLGEYVRSTNAYFLVATIIMFGALLFMSVFICLKSGRSEVEDDSIWSKRLAGCGISGIFPIVAMFALLAVCVSHLLLCILQIYTNAIVDDRNYWVIFSDASISYSLCFFLTGWMFYAWLLGVFAYKSLVFKAVTFVFAIITSLVVFQQICGVGVEDGGMIHPCKADEWDISYSDSLIAFCMKQRSERSDHSGLWTWYFFNTWAFAILAAAAAVALVVSLMCTRKSISRFETAGSSLKAHDSGSEGELIFTRTKRATKKTASAVPTAEAYVRGAYFLSDDEQ